MYSVSKRAKTVKQPRLGYIKVKDFEVTQIDDKGEIDLGVESIHASIVGMVVDYMSRYLNGASKEDAFKISLEGAKILGEYEYDLALELLRKINGNNKRSIESACYLVRYDSARRNLLYVLSHGINNSQLNISDDTISNIKIMIDRGVKFLKSQTIIKDGVYFNAKAFENFPVVSSGDGDFLSKDTLWDFKVSNKKPTSKHTLQIMMYYILGKRSGLEEFNNIHKIGFFNPRLGSIYTLDVNSVPNETIDLIKSEVFGYGKTSKDIDFLRGMFKEHYKTFFGENIDNLSDAEVVELWNDYTNNETRFV